MPVLQHIHHGAELEPNESWVKIQHKIFGVSD